MTNLNKLTLVEAAKGLREGKFTSVELTKACFDEIKLRDSEINAFLTLDEEGALAAAEAVDEKFKNGEELNVLAGIPVAVKDIFGVKGLKNTCGSNFLKDYVSPYDSSVVENLREKGAVILGKTNTDEFACGTSTESSFFGATKNPHDLERVPGGSSGGSAAAIAADMCIYSLGTDTGGSIRQPASFCGTYGLKVTYGRVSRSGITSMASSWDTIGPFAKNAEDLALILKEIAGKDRRDGTSSDRPVDDYFSYLKEGDLKGMKVGIVKEYMDEGTEDCVRESVMDAVEKMKNLGMEVVEISLPTTKYAVAAYYISMPAELSANLERFDSVRYGSRSEKAPEGVVDLYFKSRGEGFGDEIKRRILVGTYVLSAGYYDAYYKKAQKVRRLILEDFNRAFESVDFLIGPASPFPAFKIGEFTDDPLKMYLADAMTIPASCAGIPALSCPVADTKEGLKVGLQIMAPQFEEKKILKLAYHLGI